jgi:hypothetical protein
MTHWFVEIVEGAMPGSPADAVKLEEVLIRLSSEGWRVFSVLPNGVNRWTVIVRKDA